MRTERDLKNKTHKKGKKLVQRAKTTAKEIKNEVEELLETTDEIIYTAAHVITKKLNDKPTTYMSKKMHE